jgi:hypothetical protein
MAPVIFKSTVKSTHCLILKGLDSNLKMWRFYADILNDLATSLDVIAPFFKYLLLPITCLSNLCRSIVGVAGGST